MFKWFGKLAIKAYIKDLIKKIKDEKLKEKVLKYIKEHKDDVIEKAIGAIEKLIKNLVAKAIEDNKDKAEE